MKRIRIVSDGTPITTKVYDENGQLMRSVKSVEIEPIVEGGKAVAATVKFSNIELDIKASRSSDDAEDESRVA